MQNSFLKEPTEEQKNLGFRIFDLILARALRLVYNNLDEKGREEMGIVFASDDDTKKENFIKNKMPDLKDIFAKEAKIVEEELKNDIKDILA